MNTIPSHIEAKDYQLPESPVELRPEIQDAAREAVTGEQALHSSGWRGCLLKMQQADAHEWRQGFDEFCERLEAVASEARRRTMYLAVPVVVLAWLGGLLIGMSL